MVKPLAEEIVMQAMLDTWGKKFQEPTKKHAKTKRPCGFFSTTVTSEAGISRQVRTHRFKRIGQGDFAGQPEQTGLWEGFTLEEEKFITEFLGETLQEMRGHRQMIFGALKSTDASSTLKILKCWNLKSLTSADKAKKLPQSKRNEARGSLIKALMTELAYGERTLTQQLLKFYQDNPEAMKTYKKDSDQMAGRVRAMIRELLGDKELKVRAQVLAVKEELVKMGLTELAQAY